MMGQEHVAYRSWPPPSGAPCGRAGRGCCHLGARQMGMGQLQNRLGRFSIRHSTRCLTASKISRARVSDMAARTSSREKLISRSTWTYSRALPIRASRRRRSPCQPVLIGFFRPGIQVGRQPAQQGQIDRIEDRSPLARMNAPGNPSDGQLMTTLAADTAAPRNGRTVWGRRVQRRTSDSESDPPRALVAGVVGDCGKALKPHDPVPGVKSGRGHAVVPPIAWRSRLQDAC